MEYSTGAYVLLFSLGFLIVLYAVVCGVLSVYYLIAFARGGDTGFVSFAMFGFMAAFLGLGCPIVASVMPYLSPLAVAITIAVIFFIGTVVVLTALNRSASRKKNPIVDHGEW